MSQGTVSLPLVSVLMTTYNGATQLRETIDSILNQTFDDFEFLIIDDCSTDQTVAVIREYDDPRIVLARNESNQGISNSRNRALQLARGTFIATTDQDDVSAPERLERQVRCLQTREDIAVVASRVYLLIDGVRTDDPMPVQSEPILIHFALYFGRHNTTYSSLCMRKQFIVDHQLYFDQRYHYAEDYELYSRMIECGQFTILPQPLVSYRVHNSSNSRIHSEEMWRNGMSFMRDCYARELGRPIDDAEGWRIWYGLVEKRGQKSLHELRALGYLMTEMTAKFTARHAESHEQSSQIRVLASQIWHDIVDGSVPGCGLGAERVRREFNELQAWSPPRGTILKNCARAVLGWARSREDGIVQR